MSHPPHDDILNLIDALPAGPARLAALTDAISIAGETRELLLTDRLRRRMVRAAAESGRYSLMLDTFDRILAARAAGQVTAPLEVDGTHLHDLYDVVARGLLNNPAYPLARVEAVLTLMDREFTGERRRILWHTRLHVAERRTGDFDRQAWVAYRGAYTSGPTDASICQPCRNRADGITRRQSGLALSPLLVRSMHATTDTCVAEEHSEISGALYSMLRDPLPDEAAAHSHLMTYPIARLSPDNLADIGHHLVFCAVTGNAARGLALLEHQWHEIDAESENLHGLFLFLRAAAVVLDAVGGVGESARVVPPPAPLLDYVGPPPTRATSASAAVPPGWWTVAELAHACWRAVRSLAEAFDARNQGSRYSDLVVEGQSFAGQRWDVPIAGDDLAAPAVPFADPPTAAGWLDRAQALMLSGELDAAHAAVESGLALPLGDAAAEFHQIRAAILGALGRLEEYPTAHAEAVAALRARGWHDYADFEELIASAQVPGAHYDDLLGRARAALAAAREHPDNRILLSRILRVMAFAALSIDNGTAVVGSDNNPEGWTAEAVELTLPSDPLDAHASSLMLRAQVLAHQRHFDAASELVSTLLAGTASVHLRLTAMDLRSRIAEARGDRESAAASLTEAMELHLAVGNRRGVIVCAEDSAAMLARDGRPDEAAARIRVARRHSQFLHRNDLAEAAHAHALGRYLRAAGHPDEALKQHEHAHRVLTAVGLGTPDMVAESLGDLGLAQLAARRVHYDAATRAQTDSNLHEAATLATDHRLGARIAMRAARLMGEETRPYGMQRFARLAFDLVQTSGDRATYLEIVREYALLQASMGSEDALASLDQARRMADEAGRVDWMAEGARVTAQVLGMLGMRDRAVPSALAAADFYVQAGQTCSAGREEHGAGILLHDTDPEGAAVLFRAARDRFVPGSAGWRTSTLALAETLRLLGRDGEAGQL